MDEASWSVCQDAAPMVERVQEKASPRKMRLFACACCRQVWAKLGDLSRRAVEAAERFADGDIGGHELTVARRAASIVQTEWAIGDLTHEATAAADAAGDRASFNGPYYRWLLSQREFNEVRGEAPGLLRDIFGPLPFRPVTLDPAWLTWSHATVPAIARHIYDDRAFHDLPILADALEEVGCTDPDILAHCRGGGEHVRGCWVVDLILGKT